MSKCICGKHIRNRPGRGRKRSYCSDACKAKAYRTRIKHHEIEFRNAFGQDEYSNKLYHGHALSVLKIIDENSIDCLVTDPPYGYSFMGKDWDKAVPSVEIWKECLRVLKPGAFAFIMSAPRQDVLSQMIVRLSQAGFRTDFTSLYWAYASGFPKAMNIGKMVDKRLHVEREVITTRKSEGGRSGGNNEFGITLAHLPKEIDITIPATPQAKALDGSYGGFQPKPAVEVILVAMKPLSEKTFVDQALKNGKGITWLDEGRIPINQSDLDIIKKKNGNGRKSNGGFAGAPGDYRNDTPLSGRFPANLLVSNDVLNDGRMIKDTHRHEVRQFTAMQRDGSGFLDGLTVEGTHLARKSITDAGSFSRYFDLDQWFEKKREEFPERVRKTFPFLLVPKASQREKNTGLEETPNSHPTVKPLTLMSYLIILGSRVGDTILDPFMGTGTTCLSAACLGRRYIGIELNPDYITLARRRLEQ